MSDKIVGDEELDLILRSDSEAEEHLALDEDYPSNSAEGSQASQYSHSGNEYSEDEGSHSHDYYDEDEYDEEEEEYKRAASEDRVLLRERSGIAESESHASSVYVTQDDIGSLVAPLCQVYCEQLSDGSFQRDAVKPVKDLIMSSQFLEFLEVEFAKYFVTDSFSRFLQKGGGFPKVEANCIRDIDSTIRKNLSGIDDFDIQVDDDLYRSRRQCLSYAISMKRRETQSGEQFAVYVADTSHVRQELEELSMYGGFGVRIVPSGRRTSSANSQPQHFDYVASYAMDCDILQTMIARDREEGVIPLAVVATVGTPTTFHIDDLQLLRYICSQERIWLHAEGVYVIHALSKYCAPSHSVFDQVDSVCDDLCHWFSCEDHVGISFIRRRDNNEVVLPQNETSRSVFRAWSVLASHSLKQLGEEIDDSVIVGNMLRDLSGSMPGVRILGPDPVDFPHIVFFSLGEAAKDLNLDLDLFNMTVDGESQVHRWLCDRYAERIRRSCLKLYSYEGETGFLFVPIVDGVYTLRNLPHDEFLLQVEALLSDVTRDLQLLDVALSHRDEFRQYMKSTPHFSYVDVGDVFGYVGVGAFRYTPDILSQHAKRHSKEIDLVNEELAALLSSTESNGSAIDSGRLSQPPLFALVKAKDSSFVAVSVLVGIELLQDDWLLHVSSEIQKAIDRLVFPPAVEACIERIVKDGIRAAESRLQTSSAPSFAPVSLLTKVPVVGGVFGWFMGSSSDDPNGSVSFFEVPLLFPSFPHIFPFFGSSCVKTVLTFICYGQSLR